MGWMDYLYIVAVGLFVFLTFGIIRNYYQQKFNSEGRRIDMIEQEEKKV